jgi:hypothetical protein
LASAFEHVQSQYEKSAGERANARTQ